MRKLRRYFENKMVRMTGLDREEVRKAVFLSEKEYPDIHIYFEEKQAVCSWVVSFPSCRALPDGGGVLIPFECFVRDERRN